MDQNITPLCDIDPMLDDVKKLTRCISIWKSHPAGKPTEVWSLDIFSKIHRILRPQSVCPANGRESSMQHGIPYDSTTVGGQRTGGLVPNVFAVDIDVTQNLAAQQATASI
ncbi:hypothetical protein CTI12_AA282490 [Artemisia annua]|uniref:Uncharacterized protein n=1 Tax=Artemisia annua TaxID=35608 RepID=A0A2U1NCN1_ARTAN|nr:hypothetical protein CTI12_AA282490 [Artemisia annua]